MGKETKWLVGVGLAALLVWGLEQVVVAPLETGETYPEYSSLRSDPLGARALYESLAALPEVAVERWYKDRTSIDPSHATVLVLGVSPFPWEELEEKTFEEYEGIARKGGRLVIGFLPIRKPFVPINQPAAQPAVPPIDIKPPKKPALETRWNLKFSYRQPEDEDPEGRGTPKETALVMESGPEWRKLDSAGAILERNFGDGSIVLVAETFPLSNQGLREQRDTAQIVELIGPAKHVIFDENHFGVVDTGSVAELMRKYRLEGALLVLVIITALFLWRSATSFLPPLDTSSGNDAVLGRDSREGLTSLLRRGIGEKELLNACYAEWAKSAGHGVRADRRKRQVEETIARVPKDPVAGYREAQRILTERSP